jgi:uncharacterized membrane protein YcaP (DUF421 family)
MGKRQVGELEPTELVVTIMISDLASIPMQEAGIPLASGLVPILTLFVMEVLFSFVAMKNKKIRRFMSGKPSVLVRDGRIDVEEMRKIRCNRDDLMAQLRLSGCANVADVRYAILETNGQLSVLLKKEKTPLTLRDADKMRGNPPAKQRKKRRKG